MRWMDMLLATTLVAAGLGCGDDKQDAEAEPSDTKGDAATSNTKGDAGTTTTTGQSATGSKKLGQLSPAELTTVCMNVEAKAERLTTAYVSILCTEIAFGEPGCSATRQACIDDPPTDDLLDDPDEPSCAESIGSECPDITAAELEACYEAMAKDFESLSKKASCSTAAAFTEELDPPKACVDLGSRCPDLSTFE